MSHRFKILSGLYLLLLIVASSGQSDFQAFSGIGGVFAGLGSLLVFAVIALWPSSKGDDTPGKRNWADAIEFQDGARN